MDRTQIEVIKPKIRLDLRDIKVENNKGYLIDNIEKKLGKIKISDDIAEPEAIEQDDRDVPNQPITDDEVMGKQEDKPNKSVEDVFQSQEQLLIERKQMLTDIINYKQKFPMYLKDLDLDSLQHKSNPELLAIIQDIDLTIKNKANDGMNLALFGTFATLVEHIALTATPIKCQGLKDACISNDEVINVVNEIAIKYRKGPVAQLEPEYRLPIAMLQVMTQLHRINDAREKNDSKKLTPDTINKYSNY